jgi:adenylate cyclase
MGLDDLLRSATSWMTTRTGESAIAAEIGESGLLDGLTGEARKKRYDLLRGLVAGGISVEEVKAVAEQGRLPYLVLQEALEPRGGRYSLDDIETRTGIPVADVEQWFRAMGRGVAARTAVEYSDEDVNLARLLRDYRELGLNETGLFATARILGRNIWAIADAVDILLGEKLENARDEPEIAQRYAFELARIAEYQTHILAHAVAARLQQRTDLAIRGGPAGNETIEIAACFVDIVGFTSIGEMAAPTELAKLSERLDRITTELVEPPVRFVKTVGDAVMLISPDADALISAVWRLYEKAREEHLPALHAGVAWGPALPSAGDWIGAPVNMAARVSAMARANEIVIDGEMYEQMSDGEVPVRWAGSFNLKGVEDERQLYRIRPFDVVVSEDE